MSNYTQSTNFATKDSLPSGDPLKIVKGTEINTEFANISTAIATKLDSASGTISGATINSSTIGATTPSTGAFTTLSASGATTLSGVTTISDAQRPVIDNIKLGYATTATAAGTTTLTVASPHQQFFTGSLTQTIVLPVTSTLVLGLGYTITNNSTGVLTVQSSGLNDIVSIPAKESAKFVCILTSGTTAASWSYLFEGSSNIPYTDLKNISASVASNALTVTLNPCAIDFRSSTLSSGAFLTRTVPSAITLTVSSGSTLGTTSAVESKLAIVAIDNAGTVELAIVNSKVYGAFDEAVLISTTAEGGSGGADSGSVFYSTTARTSVAFKVIGYVTSTQATAGTWATTPSNVSGNSVEAPLLYTGPHLQNFSASGTFTVPAGVTSLEVAVYGGGGGGKGEGATGNAGAIAYAHVSGLTPGASISVTVGSGGAGGTYPSNGSSGGTSSFGSYVTCTGGAGGGVSANPGTLSVGSGATLLAGAGIYSSRNLGINLANVASVGPFGVGRNGQDGLSNVCVGSGGGGGGSGSGGGGAGGNTVSPTGSAPLGGTTTGIGAFGSDGTASSLTVGAAGGAGILGGTANGGAGGSISGNFGGGGGGGGGSVVVMW
jgi:hypothetical protein